MTRATGLPSSTIIAGVFVGGASRRMGGKPKGLLEAPDGKAIAARTIALARAVASEVVLVGRHPAYDALGITAIDDAAPADARSGERFGPLAGLVALLEHAGARFAIALACDMPRITGTLLARLANADDAAIVSARTDDRWSPLFARYDPARVLDAARARLNARELSLQPLFDALGARALSLDDAETRALVDWDSPEDIDST